MRRMTTEEIERANERKKREAHRISSLPQNQWRQRTTIDQLLLEDQSFSVRGNNLSAEFIIAGLAGLGVGKAYLDGVPFDEKASGPLSPKTKRGKMTRKEQIIDTANKLMQGRFSIARKGEVVDYLIDFTNEGNYAKTGVVHCFGSDRGAAFNAMQAGLALEWVRHIAAPHKRDDIPENKDEKSYSFPRILRSAYHQPVLIVGAGATGTAAAVVAACAGFRNITIMDNDEIKGHNRNRQFMYYDCDGQSKALTLAERVAEFSGADVRGIHKKLTEEDALSLPNYAVVFSCVDKVEPRQMLNRTTYKQGIPLIDAGTTAFYGEVVAAVPGKTSCIGCRRDIGGRDPDKKQSCLDVQPSIIMPNLVAGALMVAEAEKILATGTCSPHTIVYDSHSMELYKKTLMGGTNCVCGRE